MIIYSMLEMLFTVMWRHVEIETNRQYIMSCRGIPVLYECIFRMESRAKASDSILKMHECKTGIPRQLMMYCFYPTYTRFLVAYLCLRCSQQFGNGWEHSIIHGRIAELVHPEHMWQCRHRGFRTSDVVLLWREMLSDIRNLRIASMKGIEFRRVVS